MTKEITPKDLLIPHFNSLFPVFGDESYLLVGCRRHDFSASMIARAVEDCDAQILNLNVTSLETEPGDVIVSLRINHRNPQSVVQSLLRYGFQVIAASSTDESVNEAMRMRANEILRYLEI